MNVFLATQMVYDDSTHTLRELTDEEIMQYISITKKIEEISNNLKG